MYFCNIHQYESFFWMFLDFLQRLTALKGTYSYQMSCTRDDFSTKISFKEHFWRDLIGVWKITLLSKDPVEKCFYLGTWNGFVFGVENSVKISAKSTLKMELEKVCTKVLHDFKNIFLYKLGSKLAFFSLVLFGTPPIPSLAITAISCWIPWF